MIISVTVLRLGAVMIEAEFKAIVRDVDAVRSALGQRAPKQTG